jgi:hypothetical protein
MVDYMTSNHTTRVQFPTRVTCFDGQMVRRLSCKQEIACSIPAQSNFIEILFISINDLFRVNDKNYVLCHYIQMAGRSRVMRLKQSMINHIDSHTFSGPMKSGTSPSIGVTHNYWHTYSMQCNQNPNAVKKSYANMVFLNINCAQTPVSCGFSPTTPYNWTV